MEFRMCILWEAVFRGVLFHQIFYQTLLVRSLLLHRLIGLYKTIN